MAPSIPQRSRWGRFTEDLRYLVVGPRPGGRWHDGHRCIDDGHDHARCTHLVCEDLTCEVDGCHVVSVPLSGTIAYEWRHHPIWHREVLERRRKLDAGGMTLKEYKRSLWTGRRDERHDPRVR